MPLQFLYLESFRVTTNTTLKEEEEGDDVRKVEEDHEKQGTHDAQIQSERFMIGDEKENKRRQKQIQ